MSEISIRQVTKTRGSSGFPFPFPLRRVHLPRPPLAGASGERPPPERDEEPPQPGEEAAPGPLASRQASSGPGRILVVDDDPAVLETLEAILDFEGYHVLLAANALDALAQIDDRLPSLIVLDLMMPHMDGFEFVDELERRGLRDRVRILVLSADTLARQKLAPTTADAFLSKPFGIDAFLQLVARLIEAREDPPPSTP